MALTLRSSCHDAPERYSHALRALADPTRLRILHLLTEQELIGRRADEILATGQSTVSQHLRSCADAGLIVDRKDGTRSFCSRAPAPPAAAQAYAEMAAAVGATPQARRRRRGADAGPSPHAPQEARVYFDRIAEAIEHEYLPGRTWEGLRRRRSGLLPRAPRRRPSASAAASSRCCSATASEKVIGVDAISQRDARTRAREGGARGRVEPRAAPRRDRVAPARGRRGRPRDPVAGAAPRRAAAARARRGVPRARDGRPRCSCSTS
jgi:DNA-binding transcriptional ArsR family regulator